MSKRYRPELSKRYVSDPGYDGHYEPCVIMVEDPQGEWVKASETQSEPVFTPDPGEQFWGS